MGLFLFKKMKRRQQPKTETMPHAVGNHGSFSSSKLKFGILGCLYFAQGLPFGFQTKALPVYLRYHARSPPFPFFLRKYIALGLAGGWSRMPDQRTTIDFCLILGLEVLPLPFSPRSFLILKHSAFHSLLTNYWYHHPCQVARHIVDEYWLFRMAFCTLGRLSY